MASHDELEEITRSDVLFGQLLVKKSYCTNAQLKECLLIQEAERKKNPKKPPRLGDVLVRKGYIGIEQVEEILKLREQIVTLACPSCAGRFFILDYKQGAKYTCKKLVNGKPCGADLTTQTKTSITSVTAVQSAITSTLKPVPEEVKKAAADSKKIFGKYVLLNELGRGGMGVVYRAWDTGLGKVVALKFLLGEGSNPLQQGDASEEVKRFFREAQTCAALTHPNICQIYDVGAFENKHYISMQFVEGSNLAGKKFSPRKAAEVIRDIALAIHYAHGQGIIHRDIKPHNILLDKSGKCFIMDFGLARSIKAGQTLTQTGFVVGTPQFMSPEQIQGDIRKVGKHSDIYSLGATLYSLLTGRSPFLGKNPLEICNKVMTEDAHQPIELVPTIPAELNAICMKALNKLPQKRFLSAKTMADDLNRFLQGQSVEARAESAGSRMMRKALQKKAIIIPVVVSILVIIGTILYFALQSSQKENEYREIRSKADKAWEAKKYKDARDFYLRVSQLKPGDKTVSDRIAECERVLQAEVSSKLSEGQEIQKSSEARKNAEPYYTKGKLELDQALLDYYRPGVDLVETRKKLANAIQLYTKAIEICDSYTEALAERGKAQWLSFEYQRAEEDFGRVLKIQPNYIPALVDRGKLYIQRYLESILDLGWNVTPQIKRELEELTNKASSDFEKAVENGAEKQKLVFQAYAAFSENDLRRCIQLCDQAIEEDSHQEEVYKLKGDAIHFGSGSMIQHNLTPQQRANVEAEIEAYTKAINLRINYYEALIMRGNAFHFHGDEDKAKADFEAAFKLRPGDSLACWFMGTYYSQKAEAGDASAHKDALKWYNAGLEKKADSFINLMNRCVVLGKLEKYDEALVDLEKALKINPGHSHGWYMKGAILARQNKNREALDCMKKALQYDPTFYSAWYNLGAIQANLGMKSDAIESLKKAIECGHPNKEGIEDLIRKLGGGGD